MTLYTLLQKAMTVAVTERGEYMLLPAGGEATERGAEDGRTGRQSCEAWGSGRGMASK